jgi:hypothetical protein
VWTPEGAAVIAIDDLCVLSGSVEAGVMTEAKEWANSHKAAISAEWKRLNPAKQR